MSFVNALGNSGGGIHSSSGHSMLSGSTSRLPFVGKTASHARTFLGQSPIARSSADYIVNKAVDMDGNLVNRFSQSDLIRRKTPIAVPYIQSGASALAGSLRKGYEQFIDGGGSAASHGSIINGVRGSGDTIMKTR